MSPMKYQKSRKDKNGIEIIWDGLRQGKINVVIQPFSVYTIGKKAARLYKIWI